MMLQKNKEQGTMSKKLFHNSGFTLVELMVAIALTTIVGTAVVSTSILERKSSSMARQVGNMQENLRGSFYILERDIRMAGYDPTESGNFGITDIRPYSVVNETGIPVPVLGFAPTVNTPSLTMAGDDNQDTVVDPTDGDGNLNVQETISYRLFDDNNDRLWDLARDVSAAGGGVTRQLVAQGIEHMGLAYAIDSDLNGRLDTTPAGNIIWAADSDWDGILDTNLDTNDDGAVTTADDSDGNRRITQADGAVGNLAAIVPGTFPVQNDRIRAVRIWLLARTPHEVDDYRNTRRYYVVGDQIWPQNTPQTPFPLGFNDHIRRRLLVKTIECRNL
jgi:type IV pilus assembly protein PilW